MILIDFETFFFGPTFLVRAFSVGLMFVTIPWRWKTLLGRVSIEKAISARCCCRVALYIQSSSQTLTPAGSPIDSIHWKAIESVLFLFNSMSRGGGDHPATSSKLGRLRGGGPLTLLETQAGQCQKTREG